MSKDEYPSEKSCKTCRFLVRFTAKNGTWMDVCTSEEPDEEDEGWFKVDVMDTEEFDCSFCLNYKVN